MKTVLGFDSWVGGAHNFARLVPAFREKGYRLVLLHIGSWGGDKGRPTEEWFGELEVRDIAYYKGLGFDEILAKESPAAVLFLSNDVFAHRAFNRHCMHARIPTMHLYHGLVSVQSVQAGKIYNVNFFSQVRFVLERIPKALFHIWPCYADALLKTRAEPSDWIRFVSDIINLANGKYIARAAEDSQTSAVCVYAPADIAHAVTKYGYPEAQVHVVGNPDITVFGLTEDHLGCAATAFTANNREVIYLDTGLIYAGMVFDGADDFLAHLLKTQDALRSQGRTMSAKLHPHHFRTNFPDRVRTAGIEVLNNEDFVGRLQQAAAVIVEPSTAALIPAIIGVPLMLARYGKLAEQTYGNVLLGYPRARMLDDPYQLNGLIEAESSTFDSKGVNSWIAKNSGPLPAKLMPQRVTKVLQQLAGNNRLTATVEPK